MRKIITPLKIMVALSILSASGAIANDGEPKLLWTIEHLDQPESVIADPGGKLLYISNINGHPVELNGEGYISKVSTEGDVLDKYWISGLDAPKGMAIVGDNLYVADMQTLHVISLKENRVVEQFNAPEAMMLNDVTAAGDGSVYVSDLLGGAIYQLNQTTFSPWFSHQDLPHPNGVLWWEGELLIASWGEELADDFSTQIPGSLYRLDSTTMELQVVPTGYQLGNLDGIVVDRDKIYVSDWITGELYQLTDNERRKVLALNPGLADIGSAPGVIYAPMMVDNHVSAWKIE
ncbi:hypothetical protein [Nitrincola sp. MINF-07-Sa-05]|uniref:hypothetical protein n=1 Tax=Nitrincola salilacus TaxID=3400273 RepID=UPI0039182A4F